ncbi:MAG: hypothetical protein GC206_01065 [Alphaproteobacteria bacterium]|nr:hypothetical protein [Alphaproteobacteria bacterium]
MPTTTARAFLKALAIAASMALAAAALTASPAYADTRRIDGQAFHAIDASGPYEVVYTAGPDHSVVITGETRRLNRMRVQVRNGVLRISRRCTFFCSSRGTLARVEATAPSLRSFDASMGLEARANGLDADQLSVDVSMGASLTVDGRCGSLNADVSMGGALRARGLECARVMVDASMGGEADVFAGEAVDADASMGGDIDVLGAPAARRVSRSMGGDISFQ